MPRHDQSPHGADHRSHDRLLMVRFASDDLAQEELPIARSLVARCEECSLLAADVRGISLATASLAAPRRPRDFRLSQEAARQARGSIVRRLMERLSAPRLALLQPLGAAAVAIGFVLVVVGMGLPAMGGAASVAEKSTTYSAANESPAAASPDQAAPAEGAAVPSTAAPIGAPEPDPFSTPRALGGASPEGGTGIGSDAESGQGSGDSAGEPDGREAPEGEPGKGSGPTVAGGGLEPVSSAAPDEVAVAEPLEGDPSTRGGSDTPAGSGLVVLGLLLGLTGMLVIILRVLSLRTRRDPTIR